MTEQHIIVKTRRNTALQELVGWYTSDSVGTVFRWDPMTNEYHFFELGWEIVSYRSLTMYWSRTVQVYWNKTQKHLNHR